MVQYHLNVESTVHVCICTCTCTCNSRIQISFFFLYMYIHFKVMNSHSLSGGLLGDYCDGEMYSRHPLFHDDACALQIQLYFDELELCNPLGSKTHKLGKTQTFTYFLNSV